MIVKVKEPQAVERKMLSEGQLLFTYLHLAPDPDQTHDLLASGCTAIAYETVTDHIGGLPLLAPMSEVAGRLAPQVGAWTLQKANGGRGVFDGWRSWRWPCAHRYHWWWRCRDTSSTHRCWYGCGTLPCLISLYHVCVISTIPLARISKQTMPARETQPNWYHRLTWL